VESGASQTINLVNCGSSDRINGSAQRNLLSFISEIYKSMPQKVVAQNIISKRILEPHKKRKQGFRTPKLCRIRMDFFPKKSRQKLWRLFKLSINLFTD